MRISELSARSGVSVPTLKYYLREGLLPPGRATGARSAEYGDDHLERVRLVRALVESGGLSIAGVRKVVAALDSPPPTRHELMGVAQYALARERNPAADPGWRKVAGALLDDLGWQVSEESPYRADLAAALEAAVAAGLEGGGRHLAAYAKAMHRVAQIDVRNLPPESPEAALRTVVLGNVLLDPVLAALRRLAQEDVSSRRG